MRAFTLFISIFLFSNCRMQIQESSCFTYLPNKLKHEIYTTINFTRYSVTEVSALSVTIHIRCSLPKWPAYLRRAVVARSVRSRPIRCGAFGRRRRCRCRWSRPASVGRVSPAPARVHGPTARPAATPWCRPGVFRRCRRPPVSATIPRCRRTPGYSL